MYRYFVSLKPRQDSNVLFKSKKRCQPYENKSVQYKFAAEILVAA